jgi:hypothetical protein
LKSFITLFAIILSILYQEKIKERKTCYAGGYIIVPKAQVWQIDKVFIGKADGYNILISNTNFKSMYTSGDTLKAPYYLSEMELFSDKESLQYIFYLNVTED